VTTFNSVEVGENSNNVQDVSFYELNVKSQTTSATLAFQNKIKYIKEKVYLLIQIRVYRLQVHIVI